MVDDRDEGFMARLVGDGRSLIRLTAFALIASGSFALFQAATGQFLPHDVDYLGMTAKQLCSAHQSRIVHFMMHDRVSFGGVMIAIAVLYLWLAEFPLRRGESWAWYALLASACTGFLSFLAYLGYGYLDTWHGAATLALLPLFVAGFWKTRGLRRVATITTVGMTTVFVPQDLEFMNVSAAELRQMNAHLVPLIA
ncbi:MAG: hypothetical protein ACXW2X_06405, partial [Thermoanaerobaculia bacterium]